MTYLLIITFSMITALLTLYLNLISSKACFKSILRFRKNEAHVLKNDIKHSFAVSYLLCPFLISSSLVFFIISICPFFELSAVISSILLLAFFIISSLKFLVLKEPLVITDFYLLKEIMLKPSFYFSYIKSYIWLLIAIALGSVLYALLHIDYTYVDIKNRLFAFLTSFILSVSVFFMLKDKKLKYDALYDGAVFSVLSAFMLEFLELARIWRFIQKHSFDKYLEKCDIKKDYNCSYNKIEGSINVYTTKDRCLFGAENIILMQSESYCSLYRLNLAEDEGFIERDSSICFRSLLDIDYLGAYTMRTEFSVLTGIDRKKLGVFAYDPYILARSFKFPSLASKLSDKGYTCICIHPNSKYFFSRHKVMRNLGFDIFIAKESMGNDIAYKAMNSDLNLVQYVLELIDGSDSDDALFNKEKVKLSDGRLFIFVITMAAHGPYNKKEYDKRHKKAYMHDNCDKENIMKEDRGTADNCDIKTPLSVYSQKMHDFDCAIEKLTHNLDKTSSLIVYGDHLPSIDAVYNSKSRLKPDVFAYNICDKDISLSGGRKKHTAAHRCFTISDDGANTCHEQCHEHGSYAKHIFSEHKADIKQRSGKYSDYENNMNIVTTQILHQLVLRQGGL